jgi:dihydrofolate reductase
MSRDRSFRPAGVEVAPDLDAALKLAEGAEHLFICGGEDLFRQGMALAERIYLTEVKGEFGGDCRFPDLPAGRFREIWREEIEDDHDYFFSILEAGTDKSDDKGE